MKRFLILFLLVFLCSSGFAVQPKPTDFVPKNAIYAWDSVAGVFVPVTANGSSGALLFQGSFSLGSFTINPDAPYTTLQKTSTTALSTSANVSSMASRLFVLILNNGTETVWVDPGAATATVGTGLPIYSGQYYRDTLDASINVPFIASTPTALYIQQGR